MCIHVYVCVHVCLYYSVWLVLYSRLRSTVGYTGNVKIDLHNDTKNYFHCELYMYVVYLTFVLVGN